MNELLWFGMMIFIFLSISLLYRFLGKTGLYAWIPLTVILANIQVLKTVTLFGFTATLGNILYATSFLATDILSENYGKKSARKAVALGFFAMIVMTVVMNLAILFVPAESDFAQSSLMTIFGFMPRLAAASLCAFLVSQFYDVWAFEKIKQLLPGRKWLWVRNNGSTMVSQLLDTLVFTTAAFAGVYPLPVFLEIVGTTYVIKLIVAACDTPFLYFAEAIKRKGSVAELEQ